MSTSKSTRAQVARIDRAIDVGACVTRTHAGRGEVVDGGRLWAWRPRWSPRVTVVRCDRCGLSMVGDLGARLVPESAVAFSSSSREPT